MRIFALIISVFLMFSSISVAYDIDVIDSAIVHIIKKGIPKFKIHPWKKHPFLNNEEERKELAQAILEAATKHNIPPMLLVAIAFREGSFHGRREGKLGEKSTFQVIRYVAKRVAQHEPACALDGHRGASLCAAALLSRYRAQCGNLKGAFVLYATGRTCEPDSEHLKRVVKDRFRIAEFLEKLDYN